MNDILRNIHSCGKDDVWNEKSSKDGIQFMFYIESCLIKRIATTMIDMIMSMPIIIVFVLECGFQ